MGLTEIDVCISARMFVLLCSPFLSTHPPPPALLWAFSFPPYIPFYLRHMQFSALLLSACFRRLSPPLHFHVTLTERTCILIHIEILHTRGDMRHFLLIFVNIAVSGSIHFSANGLISFSPAQWNALVFMNRMSVGICLRVDLEAGSILVPLTGGVNVGCRYFHGVLTYSPSGAKEWGSGIMWQLYF